MQRKLSAKTRTAIIDDLKTLYGLPPYHGFNPCRGDGYFANSLVTKYGMGLKELERAVGFKAILRKVDAIIKQAGRVK